MIVAAADLKERDLSELVSIEIGRTPSRSNPSYWSGHQKWVTISDFEHGDTIKDTKEKISQQALRECSVRVHDTGTLIMSFKLTIGKLGILGEPMATNEAITALKPIGPDVIDERFLFHYLSQYNFDRLVDRAAKGQTLNKAKLSRITVRFPAHLNEQRRIADILDKADSVRRKQQNLLATADEFLRSAYVHTVGQLHRDFKSWKPFAIESLAEKRKGSIRSGPFGSALLHSEFVDEGVAVLGIDNAVQNKFAWDERRFITREKYEELRRYRVFPNDVIITIMGTTGRSAVVPEDIPEAITTKHLATITCNTTLVHPEFLSFAIHSDPTVIRQIEARNKGAIMDGLNLGIIRELVINVPPMEQQTRFVGLLKATREMTDQLDDPLADGSDLVKSLSQRAFRGEL